MSTYTTTHIISKEILNTPLKIETEIDKTGIIDVILYTEVKHKVVLTLDYPNWVALREAVDQHFQDFDNKRGEKIYGKTG